MLSGSVSAQMNKTDVEAFFNEADLTSVTHILIFAEIKFDKTTQDYITTKTWYKSDETTVTFKETCFSLSDGENLIYIPYTSIRTLYKGKDGWGEKAEKPIIKIDLNGTRDIRVG